LHKHFTTMLPYPLLSKHLKGKGQGAGESFAQAAGRQPRGRQPQWSQLRLPAIRSSSSSRSRKTFGPMHYIAVAASRAHCKNSLTACRHFAAAAALGAVSTSTARAPIMTLNGAGGIRQPVGGSGATALLLLLLLLAWPDVAAAAVPLWHPGFCCWLLLRAGRY
jgi:hypothetical protein